MAVGHAVDSSAPPLTAKESPMGKCTSGGRPSQAPSRPAVPDWSLAWIGPVVRSALASLRPADAPLDVGFQGAERGLMALNGQLQHVQEPLGRVQIRDDPLSDDNRLAWHSRGL